MPWNKTRLSAALHLKHPLIVAPMAGGPTTSELVISSSEAGALGSIGAAYLSANALKETAKQVRAKTQKPFGINLFIASKIPLVSDDLLRAALDQTSTFREELKLSPPKLVPPYEEDFDLQFESVLSVKPAVLSFVFGRLSPHYLMEAHKRGIFVIGTATTPDEAGALQDSGVDAIVLQGVEAGGHRGIFDPSVKDPNLSALELTRQAKKFISIPIITAGGIMTGADIRNALDAGADAVQMGTAFLATKEAGTSLPYRKRLLASPKRNTKLTRAFSGRLARGIENRFTAAVDSNPGAILPFPAQNKFTRDLRNASLAANSSDLLSLWCGTGDGELWTGSAAELIENLFS